MCGALSPAGAGASAPARERLGDDSRARWHAACHPGERPVDAPGEPAMLFLVFLLIILWVLGFITRYTLGGMLHILLVVAIVLALVNFISARARGL
jgi:hypothetical protein